ncbi:MAG: hypothetical protein KJ970_16485 [Candidatus Eisenbacteria bacterium]|uniref:Uncharacterized protein n=1 Tax=Eiseniibacteriota bacterium TaxID=2212470 RepID=A0A948RZM3_UNCEI|nr:hypothetical protein [Candidatus Eisenbacteria bacterium]MBU1947530.1 hypothetical protein [Candidatus Eisenbacteria bacterium]MBU2692519.1 hypothetical protein [Candidatus Eisenbacteria bacterium]
MNLNRLWNAIGSSAVIIGVLYAIGFIITKAFYNYLGFANVSLTTQEYLQTALVYISATLAFGVSDWRSLIFIAILIIVSYFIYRLLSLKPKGKQNGMRMVSKIVIVIIVFFIVASLSHLFLGSVVEMARRPLLSSIEAVNQQDNISVFHPIVVKYFVMMGVVLFQIVLLGCLYFVLSSRFRLESETCGYGKLLQGLRNVGFVVLCLVTVLNLGLTITYYGMGVHPRQFKKVRLVTGKTANEYENILMIGRDSHFFYGLDSQQDYLRVLIALSDIKGITYLPEVVEEGDN